MKTVVLASLLAAASFAASAQTAVGDLPFQNDVAFDSSKTRAEVIAELRQAQAQDLISFGNLDKRAAPSKASPLTRDQVAMEVADLASAGKLYQNSTASRIHLN